MDIARVRWENNDNNIGGSGGYSEHNGDIF